MKTRAKDYLTRQELLRQLAGASEELAETARFECYTLEDDSAAARLHKQTHENLLEDIADLYCCLGELLSLEDWEEVAYIRAEIEKRWITELEGKRNDEEIV